MRAGASGKLYYAVSLHHPSPLDQQAASAAAPEPAQPGARSGGFQAPAGFVLKGQPSR